MEYKLNFQTYEQALRKDKLLGLKCKECNAISTPPRMTCRKCDSTDMEVIELTGKGKIQSFTTSYVVPEGRECEAPYIVVLVELDEGPWLMGNLTGIDPTKVTMEVIGKRVKMGHKVFPGDKYSAGDAARPLFSFET